jgi:hypothetical protein
MAHPRSLVADDDDVATSCCDIVCDDDGANVSPICPSGGANVSPLAFVPRTHVRAKHQEAKHQSGLPQGSPVQQPRVTVRVAPSVERARKKRRSVKALPVCLNMNEFCL